eukprot:1159201-Pelagomonas_calceolata.AAC.13
MHSQATKHAVAAPQFNLTKIAVSLSDHSCGNDEEGLEDDELMDDAPAAGQTTVRPVAAECTLCMRCTCSLVLSHLLLAVTNILGCQVLVPGAQALLFIAHCHKSGSCLVAVVASEQQAPPTTSAASPGPKGAQPASDKPASDKPASKGAAEERGAEEDKAGPSTSKPSKAQGGSTQQPVSLHAASCAPGLGPST